MNSIKPIKLTTLDLCEIVDKNNIQKLKDLLDSGLDVNYVGEFGHTLICMLAQYGASCKMVEFLLDKGADINLTNDGYNSLHMACLNGRVRLILLLISRGVSITQRNEKGQTPYDIAINQGIIAELDVVILKALRPYKEYKPYKHKKIITMYAFSSLASNDVAVVKFLQNNQILICSHKGLCQIYEMKEIGDGISLTRVMSIGLKCNPYSIDEATHDGNKYLGVVHKYGDIMQFYEFKKYGRIVNVDAELVNVSNATSLSKYEMMGMENPFCLPNCISWDFNGTYVATGTGGEFNIWKPVN
jgi:hypothetical protein